MSDEVELLAAHIGTAGPEPLPGEAVGVEVGCEEVAVAGTGADQGGPAQKLLGRPEKLSCQF